MGVFDVQHETDVGQFLLAVTMIDVMDDEYLRLGHVLYSGAGHATRHPASEGMTGNNEPEFKFGKLGALLRNQMLGGDDATDPGLSDRRTPD